MREFRPLHHRHTNFMYSIADLVRQEVTAPQQISADVFPDFLADNNIQDVHERIARPSKRTLLHSFIVNLSNSNYDWLIRKAPECECDHFRALISEVGLPIPVWLNEDTVGEHKDELSVLCRNAINAITESVFNLLFSDRNVLFCFQRRISEYIKTLSAQQNPILASNGVVARANYIPSWLEKAIYFRDQGRCQLGFHDISGLNSPNIAVHLDHMVPLAAGGSNDPTNFQLTCGTCNTSKGPRTTVIPAQYEPYWRDN